MNRVLKGQVGFPWSKRGADLTGEVPRTAKRPTRRTRDVLEERFFKTFSALVLLGKSLEGLSSAVRVPQRLGLVNERKAYLLKDLSTFALSVKGLGKGGVLGIDHRSFAD